MNRYLILATALSTAVLAGVPSAVLAQDPAQSPSPYDDDPTPRLATPLAAGCQSPAFGDRSGQGLDFKQLSITGGKPGHHFQVTSGGQDPSVYEQSHTLAGQVGGSGTFDANGNATLSNFRVARFLQPAPGVVYRFTLYTDRLTSGERLTKTLLGHASVAALGAVTTFPNGSQSGSYRAGTLRRVTVSGAPFAGKTLYGFIVKGGSKVVGRFKLGTGDACGYAAKNVVTWPKAYRNYTSLKVYVNAGPRFDKARSVHTRST